MQPIDTEFHKWQQWAECVKSDVQTRLVNPRQVFRGFFKVVNANAEHISQHDGGTFCKFVRDCYVSHVVMAIRRHIKQGDGSISLMRLLIQIRDCAGQFTCQFFLRQFPIDSSYVNWQRVTFSLFSEDGQTVSTRIVQKDIDDLKALTAKVEKLADKSLAHLDKSGFDGSVTFGDLDHCIDAFDALVCKYVKLTTGTGYATLEPTILTNWEEVFTVPFDMRVNPTFT